MLCQRTEFDMCSRVPKMWLSAIDRMLDVCVQDLPPSSDTSSSFNT